MVWPPWPEIIQPIQLAEVVILCSMQDSKNMQIIRNISVGASTTRGCI